MHTRPAWYVALRALKRVWIWNTVIIIAVTADDTMAYNTFFAQGCTSFHYFLLSCVPVDTCMRRL